VSSQTTVIEGQILEAPTLFHKSIVLFIVIVPFLGVLFSIWQLWNKYVGLYDIVILLCTYLPITFGVTMGLHRLFTHKSFKANPYVRYILAGLAELSLEGGVIKWVADHRMHHQFSDKEGDLHSPAEGLFYAHIGWFFGGKKADANKYAPDLLNDRWLVLFDRMYPIWIILSIFTIPFLLGGWQGVLWAGLIRIFLVHHATWSINSICHTFGVQDYLSNDSSKNVWWLAPITLGESYHNNHHTYAVSAKHGNYWWEDPTYCLIRVCEWFGLVSDVKTIPVEMWQQKKLRRR
jgi:stearoyl-CoA desaturase (Delta-9 desaturase)